mmetsp:Transcript_3191/g.3051  ORF Transcript_3191/g.3051 Transcript_3191/m.3051 type:complete len:200 (-) Transcript_3191:82-681(-)|eukprot:CAMPEP_0197829168 /NCGR_PEP_ID=MMETSP1437-20131217/5625_1 /TAXON_ID=49252 ORGANISM="Eucampia antarctica, Strain CCMP1452" /NCGR_SAMPLE_ID=MMETSP1437 /ASSEMBLY_ACC=CAM_ASM_001096 /LENGTH=199 /DNA_ID=CAMNT_0043430699 /DNA_START=47 /DNA_END=646 /DNA_ORIENTATION=+
MNVEGQQKEQENDLSSRTCTDVLKEHNPEYDPELWFCINLGLAISAILMALRLSSGVSEDTQNFPSYLYLFYMLTNLSAWCCEATTTLFATEKTSKVRYASYVEVAIALYFLSEMLYYLLISDSDFPTETRVQALPGAKLDAVCFFLMCIYNVYCIKRNRDESLSSSLDKDADDNDATPYTAHTDEAESGGRKGDIEVV